MTRAFATRQPARARTLAAARLDDAGEALHSRILSEPLATFPVIAATPANDPQWSTIVAWAIYTLQRAELPATPWTAGGFGSVKLDAPELGLAKDWQKRVAAAAGTYAEIYARNLGEDSRLGLARGPNAPHELGGLFLSRPIGNSAKAKTPARDDAETRFRQ